MAEEHGETKEAEENRVNSYVQHQQQSPILANGHDFPKYQQVAHGPLPLQNALMHHHHHHQQQQQQQQQLLLAVAQQNAGMGLQPAVLAALQQQATVTGLTHNLIPEHLQATVLAASLHGTPGFHPSLVHPGIMAPSPSIMPPPAPPAPIYTVQDRPTVPPVYNGINLNYPGVHMLHATPPVYAVENFLTPFECDFLVAAANDSWSPAPVVGKGAGEVSASRTSSTCYLAREDLPDYLRKVSLLTGKPVEHCELPQVGRYLHTQQYLQHFDAFDLSNEDGRRFAANGGQRVVTVLVYLNDVPQGGSTFFPALNLKVQPRRGMALVFFPATVDGLLDRNALHAALPAMEPFTKYVSQVWIRQGNYNGHPSKRLSHTLGVPFHQQSAVVPGQQQHQQIPFV